MSLNGATAPDDRIVVRSDSFRKFPEQICFSSGKKIALSRGMFSRATNPLCLTKSHSDKSVLKNAAPCHIEVNLIFCNF